MTAKRYRWKCPRCDAGVLASSKPRKNATVRYCLPCSKKTGSLVERTCPTLDRQRSDKQAARAAKAKRQRESKRRSSRARQARATASRAERKQARYEVAGDLRPELSRLWALSVPLSARDDLNPDKPPTFLQRSRKDEWVSGHAYYSDPPRIVVSVGVGADVAAAYGTLAHEVAHLCAPPSEHHGPGFWTLLCEIVRVAYGAEPCLENQTRAWHRQKMIEHAIRDVREKAGL